MDIFRKTTAKELKVNPQKYDSCKVQHKGKITLEVNM